MIHFYSCHFCLLIENISQHRFELMVPKIVKLLSYRNVFASNAAYYSYCEEHVMPCLSSVALAVGSDVLWKPINHKILIMTRSDKVSVRIVAIKTIKHLFHEVRIYSFLFHMCNTYQLVVTGW